MLWTEPLPNGLFAHDLGALQILEAACHDFEALALFDVRTRIKPSASRSPRRPGSAERSGENFARHSGLRSGNHELAGGNAEISPQTSTA